MMFLAFWCFWLNSRTSPQLPHYDPRCTHLYIEKMFETGSQICGWMHIYSTVCRSVCLPIDLSIHPSVYVSKKYASIYIYMPCIYIHGYVMFIHITWRRNDMWTCAYLYMWLYVQTVSWQHLCNALPETPLLDPWVWWFQSSLMSLPSGEHPVKQPTFMKSYDKPWCPWNIAIKQSK